MSPRTGLFVLLLIVTSQSALAQRYSSQRLPEVPKEKTEALRFFGMLSLSRTSLVKPQALFDRADRFYDEGNYERAAKGYRFLARFGDKYAQFRMGLIGLHNDDPVEAHAWFKIAQEGKKGNDVDEFVDGTWAAMNDQQRSQSEARVLELRSTFGDFALAERLQRAAKKRVAATTGSRLGFVGPGLDVNYHEFQQNEAGFLDEYVDRYGYVEFGEFSVIDDDQKPADEKADKPDQ